MSIGINVGILQELRTTDDAHVHGALYDYVKTYNGLGKTDTKQNKTVFDTSISHSLIGLLPKELAKIYKMDPSTG